MTERPSILLARHRDRVRQRVHERGFADPRVFGSVANGDDRAGSDLDLLVSPGPSTGMFDLAGLALDLEELLGVHVDVVSSGARLADTVRSQAVPL